MIATIMPAVETLDGGLDWGEPEFDCTGERGGVAEGAAGVEVVLEVEEVVEEEEEELGGLVVVEVARVVRVRLERVERLLEVPLVVDVPEDVRVDLVVVVSSAELDDVRAAVVVEGSIEAEITTTVSVVAVGVISVVAVL